MAADFEEGKEASSADVRIMLYSNTNYIFYKNLCGNCLAKVASYANAYEKLDGCASRLPGIESIDALGECVSALLGVRDEVRSGDAFQGELQCKELMVELASPMRAEVEAGTRDFAGFTPAYNLLKVFASKFQPGTNLEEMQSWAVGREDQRREGATSKGFTDFAGGVTESGCSVATIDALYE